MWQIKVRSVSLETKTKNLFCCRCSSIFFYHNNFFSTPSRYKDALGGLWVVVILFLCYVLSETLRICRSVWLSKWTDQGNIGPSETVYYNMIYGVLSLSQVWVYSTNNLCMLLIFIFYIRIVIILSLSFIPYIPNTTFDVRCWWRC